MSRNAHRQWVDPSATAVLRLLAAGEVPAAGDRRWWEDAACLGLPTDLFFPEVGERAAVPRKVCAACSVRDACLDDALTIPVERDLGVRGGLTETERAALRRNLKRSAA